MSEKKRLEFNGYEWEKIGGKWLVKIDGLFYEIDWSNSVVCLTDTKIVDLLNEQQATISQLEEEKGYWKSKAMTLLMQVRRLIPRMSDKEVIEFSRELDDE